VSGARRNASPGPWIYQFGAVYAVSTKGAATTESRILLADRENPSTSPIERDANLRLAAEAPALEKACEAALAILLEHNKHVSNLDGCRTKAVDVLAAALWKARQ